MSTLQAHTDANPVVNREDRRAARHQARRTLWKESSLRRIRSCGRSLTSVAINSTKNEKQNKLGVTGGVGVKLAGGVAGFSGLQSCGSAWGCPVCSQKIASSRATDVQRAVNHWHSMGGKVAFLTLTMRHRKGQRLEDLWDALAHSWNKVTSGAAWKNEAALYGTPQARVIKSGKNKGATVVEKRIPYVRAVEVTHGKNGWHVHIHALLFLSPGLTGYGLTQLAQTVYARWANALVTKGLASPTPVHGVDIKLVSPESPEGEALGALGRYFAKAIYTGSASGWEVVGGAGKTARGTNRTPFQILADVVAVGDADDLGLWWEYEAASHGRRQLTWSVGLRALVGLDDEKTDQEIAEEEIGGEVVMVFTREEWDILKWHSERVLALVESGADRSQVLAVLLH